MMFKKWGRTSSTKDRLKLARERIAQDGGPDALGLGQREAHPAPLKLRGIAGHRIRPADHHVLDAAGAREGR